MTGAARPDGERGRTTPVSFAELLERSRLQKQTGPGGVLACRGLLFLSGVATIFLPMNVERADRSRAGAPARLRATPSALAGPAPALLRPRSIALALFRCRSTADAEDIAAETFVQGDRSPAGAIAFRASRSFPWLSRIATNLVVDQAATAAPPPRSLSYDQKTRRRTSVRSWTDSLEAGRSRPARPRRAPRDPDELTGGRDREAARRPGRRDTGCASGATCHWLEIAAALGRSEGAIKSLIHRGLVNLRKSLIRSCRRDRRHRKP